MKGSAIRATAAETTSRIVMRKASKGFTPSAQRTIHATSPTVKATSTCTAETLAERRGQLGHHLAHRPWTALAGGADQPAAHDHAVGEVGHLPGLLRACDPEAHGDRYGGGRADPLHSARELGWELVALSGGAPERDRVDEAARVLPDLAQPGGRRGGSHQRYQREPLCVARRPHLAGLVVR